MNSIEGDKSVGKDSGIELIMSSEVSISQEQESKGKDLDGDENDSSDSDNDIGDINHSILALEIQDARNHSSNLCLRLQNCEDQLRIRTKQYHDVLKDKEDLQAQLTALQDTKKQNDEKFGQKIIDISGRNEWLEGQSEQLKSLCNKLKKKLDINSPNSDLASKHSQTDEVQISTPLQDVTTTSSGEVEEDFDKTLHVEISDGDEELDQKKETTEEKPASTNITKSDDLKKKINAITCLSIKNDLFVQKLALNCHTLIQENNEVLQKIYEENRLTGEKLECWIESYMVLKRKHEEGEEIYQRELQKSWNIEKEYKSQIKNLCDMIARLNRDVYEAKNKNTDYEKGFEAVMKNLKKLDCQFDSIVEVTNEKVSTTEQKLQDLATKYDGLSNSPSFRKRTPVKRFSRNLFKLRRRLSESNESLQEK